MDLNDYLIRFTEDIRDSSVRDGETPKDTFLKKIVTSLEEINVIADPTFLSFYKKGINGRIMAFDLFSFEKADNSITFLINDYVDDEEPGSISLSDINTLFNKMLNFIEESYTGNAIKYIDPSSDVYKFSKQLKERLEIDFLKLQNDESIDKIKLIIITNKKVSKRVKGLAEETFLDRAVEKNVWDIERIYEMEKTSQTHEPVYIDVRKYTNGKGLPYLKADFEKVKDYESFLSIVPGKFLSDIYYEFGANLLEGNVRSFLGVKGKYNKGIQRTIREEPDKFFIYNNGIACTALEVTFSDDGREIVAIKDLQIINGGQTTASLSTSFKKRESNLDDIFVPMKLTIIKNTDSVELVSNIARYANSQNKVTDADFFSSHPFHSELEKISKRVHAPGSLHTTIWYYERARGMYQQEQFKLKSKTEIDSFLKKFPKNQVIKKEQLSKYIFSAQLFRPDIVSRGAQFATKEFANYIDQVFEKDRSSINDYYFKKIVVYAIIFRDVDSLISKASWYQTGGYKLNLVPYTISKIISSIPSNKEIDIEKIWKNQMIYPSFARQVNVVAPQIDRFIKDSGGMIVTEYAKKQSTWEKLKEIKISLLDEFIDDLFDKSLSIATEKTEKKKEVEKKEISIENEIVRLAFTEECNYWSRLLQEGKRRKLISQEEDDIISRYLIPLSRGANKVPSSVQMKKIWAFRERLSDEGVLT